MTPEKVSEEEQRVCDSCIQVVDEKLAEGMNKRFGKSEECTRETVLEDQENSSRQTNQPKHPEKQSGRAVITMGRYRYFPSSLETIKCVYEYWWIDRAEIKESEGNRYIRDDDL